MKRKNSVAAALDSFISTVNRTGEGATWLVALLFIGGGLFSVYMGYDIKFLPLLAGGPLAILIGIMLLYRAFSGRRRK